MTSQLQPDSDLARLLANCTDKALQSGALQPIRTEQTTVEEAGIRFSVRWVSSLARKDAARVAAVSKRDPDFDPFLPPEPELTAAALGERHLAVLNKYPVIANHLLIITRAFEAQTAPLTAGDFAALAQVQGPLGGLGFYNGGTEAGASQAHKHLQWVPAPAGLDAFAAHLPQCRPSESGTAKVFDWAHCFIRLPASAWQAGDAGRTLRQCFVHACELLGLPCEVEAMAPYNLLLTHEWLLLIPRKAEKWREISVNALGYSGSLFVRRPEQIDELRAAGPFAVLRGVGLPR